MTTIVKINNKFYFNLRYLAVKLSFEYEYVETVLSEIYEDIINTDGEINVNSDNMVIYKTPNIVVCDFSMTVLLVSRLVSVVDQVAFLSELNEEMDSAKLEDSTEPMDMYEYIESLTLAQNLFDRMLDVRLSSGMEQKEAYLLTMMDVYKYTKLEIFKEAYDRALSGHPPETLDEKNEILIQLGLVKATKDGIIPTEKAKPYLITESTWNDVELDKLFNNLRSLYGNLSNALHELSK